MFIRKKNIPPKRSYLESFIKSIIGTINLEKVDSSQISRNAKILWNYYNKLELNKQTGTKIENFMKLFVEPPLKKVDLEEKKPIGYAGARVHNNFEKSLDEVEKKQKEIVAPALNFIKDFISKNETFYKERILYIIGDMGSGKTTLCKFIAYSSLKSIIDSETPLSANYFPIYIKASSFIKSFVIENESLSAMATLLEILKKHRLDMPPIHDLTNYDLIPILFLIDGVDEIDTDLQTQLFAMIDLLISEFSHLKIILTFRTSILGKVLNAGNIFSTNQVFSTEKWEKDIIIQYITYKLQNDSRLLNELKNNNINKLDPRELWDKLSDIFDIKELATNPFMLNALLDLLPSLILPNGELIQNVDRIYIYESLIRKRMNENFDRMRSIVNTNNSLLKLLNELGQNKERIKLPLREELWNTFIQLFAFFIMASPSNDIKIKVNYNPTHETYLDINRIMFGQNTIFLDQIITDINPFIDQDLIDELQYYGIDLSTSNGKNTSLSKHLKNLLLDSIMTNTLLEVSKNKTSAYVKLNFVHKSLPEFIVARVAADEMRSNNNQTSKYNWFHSIFFSKETFEFFLEITYKENITITHKDLCNFIKRQECFPLFPDKVPIKAPELLHIILNKFYGVIRDLSYLPNNLEINDYVSKPTKLSGVFQTQNDNINLAIEEFLKLILYNSNTIIFRGLSRRSLNFIFEHLSIKNNWANIKFLDLSYCNISSLPEGIGALKNLKELYLFDNQLSSLPESIGALKNLKELYLFDNQLSSLPESIGTLKNLKELWIYNNQLSYLPESINALKNLQILDLRKNHLSSLPEIITKMTWLKVLNIGGNQLSSLPESIGRLKNLQGLDLGGNQLSSLPESIGRLKNLQTLDLYGNQLPSLPESIGTLKNLQTLVLSWNNLSSLPESIGALKNLTYLNLVKNNLSSLPESIGALKNLQTLVLSWNNLSSLPKSIERWLEQLEKNGCDIWK